MLTVDQAAEALQLSGARIRLLCAEGRILATKHGRDWIIHKAKVLPPARAVGRPVKRRGAGK